jgi:alpha-galactosidase
VILGPTRIGLRPGRPFVHRLGLDAVPGAHVELSGLPPGLAFDPATRVISGRTADRGSCTVIASIDGEAARGSLDLVVGDEICLTPPLGWNSWNAFGASITEEDVRSAADVLLDSGLADLGWTAVNIDDGWQGDRDSGGRIRPNEKFRDLGALCGDLHARGLHAGIYSSPGPRTCGGFIGSLGHEFEDARSFADWGFDYLKHDWCSAGPHDGSASLDELAGPYEVMRDALDRVDRDIVYHLCQYGLGEVWRWARERVRANAWRTTGDIDDSWPSIDALGFGQADLAGFAGPGGWNDPDMLVVGDLGGAWNRPIRPTRLTPGEERSHLTLWVLLAAPLLLGCDLTALPGPTLDLLRNPEVIAIHQDVAGRQATRAWSADRFEVWTKPLHDGSTAVGIFNRGDAPARASVDFAALGLTSDMIVRDAWARSTGEDSARGWDGDLGAHGCALLVVGP